MRGFVGGVLVGVLLTITLAWINSRTPETQRSTPCALQVTNKLGQDLVIVPLSSAPRLPPKSGVTVPSNATVRVTLAAGECDGVAAYPEGPVWGIVAIDPATKAIKSVKTFTGEFQNISIDE